MRKKTFYQTNILWQLFCLMFLATFTILFIVGIQLIIGIINNGLGDNYTDVIVSLILLILYFIATLFILKLFIRLEHNNVHLDSDKIYMNDDWLNKREKIQYYEEVKYIDIEAIEIIRTEKNSKGKKIKSWLMSTVIEKPYLSLVSKKGQRTNFFIMYITKKDVTKLIDEIKKRMIINGNMVTIEETSIIVSKLKK